MEHIIRKLWSVKHIFVTIISNSIFIIINACLRVVIFYFIFINSQSVPLGHSVNGILVRFLVPECHLSDCIGWSC